MSATLTESTALAEEVRRDDADTFVAMVRRLSRQSVDKHFDAYADIDWDDPDYGHRSRRSALGSSSRRPARRAPTGTGASRPTVRVAHRPAPRTPAAMKIGCQFENILKRGLLEHAFVLPNNRARVPLRLPRGHRGGAAQPDVPGVRQPDAARPCAACRGSCRSARDRVVTWAAYFPAAVLHVRARRRGPDRPRPARAALRGDELAPAARAHHAHPRHRGGPPPLLRPPLPQAGGARAEPVRRHILAVAGPLVLGTMARLMLAPRPTWCATAPSPRRSCARPWRARRATSCWPARSRRPASCGSSSAS